MFKPLKNANIKIALALSALLLAVGALYYPGASGPYLLDDDYHLALNKNIVVGELSWSALGDAAASTKAGPLRRPISMASFALNFSLAGNTAPYPVKLTNIALHLITTFGIFLLTTQLLIHFNKDNPANDPVRQRWIALFITALWALHPLNVTTVLYAIQRMNGLAGLFTIFSAVIYIKGRERLLRGETIGLAWAGGAVIIGGALATLSKENGALLPILLLAIELTVLRFKTHATVPALARRLLIGLLVIPTLAIVAYLIYQTFDATSHYQMRPFSLAERLLTEARVMFHYLHWILLPDIRSMGLFHDDIQKSTSFFNPVTTGLALAGIAALAVVALAGMRRARLRILSFSIMWFLGGHLLESTTIPLELVFEHRNYIPAYGPLFALGYYLTHNNLWETRLRPTVKASLIIALLALPANGLYQRSKYWSTYQDFILQEVNNHPRSARAAYFLGNSLYVAGYYPEALEYLRTASQFDPDDTSYSVNALSVTYRLGKMPEEQLLVQIERSFKTGYTTFVAPRIAELIEAHAATVNPAYPPITERILTAYAQALLDKPDQAGARARAKGYYLLILFSLHEKNTSAALATLTRALVESLPAEHASGIGLEVAALYLKHGKLDKAENELMRIDTATLSISQQSSLAELRKQLIRKK